MNATCRWMMVAGIALVVPAAAHAQVVADRHLVSVYGQVITQSDVYQALEMRWLPDGVTAFEAAQRELENRLLILREAGRVGASAPSAEAVASARDRWQQRFGVADAAGRMAKAGVTDAMLDAWCRDAAVIDAYLDRRFGGVRPSDRTSAIASWIRLLRERAGLPQ